VILPIPVDANRCASSLPTDPQPTRSTDFSDNDTLPPLRGTTDFGSRERTGIGDNIHFSQSSSVSGSGSFDFPLVESRIANQTRS